MPGAAVGAAASVKIALLAPGAAMRDGAKEADTPAGTPLTATSIPASNPLAGVVVKVIGTDPPGGTLALVTLEANEKVAAGRTVRVTATDFSIPAPSAPMVNVETPAGVVEAADSVNTVLPLPGAGIMVLLKPAVTPARILPTDKYTAALKPLPAEVVIVKGTEPPATTVMVAAPAESV